MNTVRNNFDADINAVFRKLSVKNLRVFTIFRLLPSYNSLTRALFSLNVMPLLFYTKLNEYNNLNFLSFCSFFQVEQGLMLILEFL